MPRERKFYFEPLKAKKGKPVSEDFIPFASLHKGGTLHISSKAMTFMKVDSSKSLINLRLFVDRARRTLGWQFTTTVGSKDDGYRTVSVIKDPKYPTNHRMVISIGSFLSELKNVPEESLKLDIEKYKDTELDIELFYITIPTAKDGDRINPIGSRFHPLHQNEDSQDHD